MAILITNLGKRESSCGKIQRKEAVDSYHKDPQTVGCCGSRSTSILVKCNLTKKIHSVILLNLFVNFLRYPRIVSFQYPLCFLNISDVKLHVSNLFLLHCKCTF